MNKFNWNFSNGDILNGISCNDKDTVPVFFNRNELIGNCVIEKTGNQIIGHFKLSIELANDTYLVAASSLNSFDQIPREFHLEAFFIDTSKKRNSVELEGLKIN